MTAYPVMLDGAKIVALVVGGGGVAARKVAGLVEAAARVTVVAPEMSAEIERIARDAPAVRLVRRVYEPQDLAGATLVFAATSSRDVNDAVRAEALRRNVPANVADAPDDGTFTGAAVHRAGDLVIAVSAGGVPGAAARVRDELARRFDERYARAVGTLAATRRRLLSGGERARWRDAAAALLNDAFCDSVESGEIETRAATWR